MSSSIIMRRFRQALVAVLTLFVFTGCFTYKSSVGSIVREEEPPNLFGGVREHIDTWTGSGWAVGNNPFVILFVLDIPFSLVADVILFPVWGVWNLVDVIADVNALRPSCFRSCSPRPAGL